MLQGHTSEAFGSPLVTCNKSSAVLYGLESEQRAVNEGEIDKLYILLA